MNRVYPHNDENCNPRPHLALLGKECFDNITMLIKGEYFSIAISKRYSGKAFMILTNEYNSVVFSFNKVSYHSGTA